MPVIMLSAHAEAAIKGKGMMRTYFLHGRLCPGRSDPAGPVGPDRTPRGPPPRPLPEIVRAGSGV